MGNKKDGHNIEAKKEGQTRLDNEVEKYGNSDVKALAAVYHEFTKDGILGDKEKQALETMDKALKGVDLIYGYDKDAALLVDEQSNDCFLLLGTAYKQNIQNKKGPGK